MKNVSAIIFCILLAACATPAYWKDWSGQKTGQELAQDNYECLNNSQQYASQAYTSANPYGARGSAAGGYGTNANLYNTCMIAKGYFSVTPKTVSDFKDGFNKGLKAQQWRISTSSDLFTVRSLLTLKDGSPLLPPLTISKGIVQGEFCTWSLSFPDPNILSVPGAPSLNYFPPARVELSQGDGPATPIDFKISKDFEVNGTTIGGHTINFECDGPLDAAIISAASAGAHESPVLTLVGGNIRGRIIIDSAAFDQAYRTALRSMTN